MQTTPSTTKEFLTGGPIECVVGFLPSPIPFTGSFTRPSPSCPGLACVSRSTTQVPTLPSSALQPNANGQWSAFWIDSKTSLSLTHLLPEVIRRRHPSTLAMKPTLKSTADSSTWMKNKGRLPKKRRFPCGTHPGQRGDPGFPAKNCFIVP